MADSKLSRQENHASRSSCLTERHLQAGAKFADFAGWRMPIEYAGTGVLAEHAAVREAVGIFDVSHLGTVRIAGAGAVAFANQCFTNDLDRIGAGGAQYTLCCDPTTGEVIDDLIVYRVSDDHVLCVPNAANTPAVVARLRAAAPEGVTVDDASGTHGIIAVQGPKSTPVLGALGLPTALEYMGFASASWAGVPVTVARSGYTGERGYEVVVPAAAAPKLWGELLDAGSAYGIRPCGLGARDTLRTEMGYPLHGQALGHGISALQAGLGWVIGWRKPEFWGSAALRAEREAGPDGRIVGLSFEGRGVPRPAMPVFADAESGEGAGNEPIGTVTSGTFSPTLRNGVALALLRNPGPWLAMGSRVQVDVRGRRIPATVVKPPFVESHVR